MMISAAAAAGVYAGVGIGLCVPAWVDGQWDDGALGRSLFVIVAWPLFLLTL